MPARHLPAIALAQARRAGRLSLRPCPTDARRGGGRVAQSFRAASIGRAKALRYRYNKDDLHNKNENYFMSPVINRELSLADYQGITTYNRFSYAIYNLTGQGVHRVPLCGTLRDSLHRIFLRGLSVSNPTSL